ncbi:MAG TPA: DUF2723 domain-containing protein [Gemmatimonadaceae bacterium]|nr:DUF2723 domain-containing protein [Gemmatimonadaceae bacterium]
MTGALLLVYALTLAPTVTYWDAGEFLAAMHSLGIPHPPGTPLYVLIGNVWGNILEPIIGFARAVNLLSAASTAAACGIFTWLMMRWTRRTLAAAAGGLPAGLMSSVWLNATETEVYAPALLVSALLLLAAQRFGETRDSRWLVMLGYLGGLAWALQLSALVAAPASILLAFALTRGSSLKIPIVRIVAAALLGSTAVIYLLIRAQHDPAINQGNPETWPAFLDVITRAQYKPAPIFPRQAPWFIQIGNLFEYADWQIALGLDPSPPPSWRRTPFTILFGALGGIGCMWHRRTNKDSWRVMMFLFVCATLGVIAYLNMKAGPSYGHGFLPEGAKHEARERDYFFALGFVCWGMWAGAGAVHLLERINPRLTTAALAIVALPFVLNFSAVDRSAPGAATVARDSARRILLGAPARAVVFANGDNDTYPVWYAQQVENTRRDVTVVTIPLLGATWYRAELARRHGLLTPEYIDTWRGAQPTVEAVCTAARLMNRIVVNADCD